MTEFDVELDHRGLKAVMSVKTRVSVEMAKLLHDDVA